MYTMIKINQLSAKLKNTCYDYCIALTPLVKFIKQIYLERLVAATVETNFQSLINEEQKGEKELDDRKKNTKEAKSQKIEENIYASTNFGGILKGEDLDAGKERSKTDELDASMKPGADFVGIFKGLESDFGEVVSKGRELDGSKKLEAACHAILKGEETGEENAEVGDTVERPLHQQTTETENM